MPRPDSMPTRLLLDCVNTLVDILTDACVIVSLVGTKKPPSVLLMEFTPSLNSTTTSEEPSEKVVTVDAAAKGVKIIRSVKNNDVFIRLFTIAMLSPIAIQYFYA